MDPKMTPKCPQMGAGGLPKAMLKISKKIEPTKMQKNAILEPTWSKIGLQKGVPGSHFRIFLGGLLPRWLREAPGHPKIEKNVKKVLKFQHF